MFNVREGDNDDPAVSTVLALTTQPNIKTFPLSLFLCHYVCVSVQHISPSYKDTYNQTSLHTTSCWEEVFIARNNACEHTHTPICLSHILTLSHTKVNVTSCTDDLLNYVPVMVWGCILIIHFVDMVKSNGTMNALFVFHCSSPSLSVLSQPTASAPLHLLLLLLQHLNINRWASSLWRRTWPSPDDLKPGGCAPTPPRRTLYSDSQFHAPTPLHPPDHQGLLWPNFFLCLRLIKLGVP